VTNVKPSEGDRTWLLDTPGGRDSLIRRVDDPFGGLVGRVLMTHGTELHL
jgi:hypothetical protein